MSSKQSDCGNRVKIKKLCISALLTAVCIVFGYIESLLPLDFIAPGIKLGLANTVTLLLAARGEIKTAFAVNTARIMLCALLFGSALSLLYSLCGGIISLIVVCLLCKIKSVSLIGCSIAGGVIHNLVQTAVAVFTVGKGVLFYTPFLIIGGAVCGTVTAVLCMIILKKIETNKTFWCII